MANVLALLQVAIVRRHHSRFALNGFHDEGNHASTIFLIGHDAAVLHTPAIVLVCVREGVTHLHLGGKGLCIVERNIVNVGHEGAKACERMLGGAQMGLSVRGSGCSLRMCVRECAYGTSVGTWVSGSSDGSERPAMEVVLGKQDDCLQTQHVLLLLCMPSTNGQHLVERPSMRIVVATASLYLVGWHLLDIIAPSTAQFNGSFHSLHASVHW